MEKINSNITYDRIKKNCIKQIQTKLIRVLTEHERARQMLQTKSKIEK